MAERRCRRVSALETGAYRTYTTLFIRSNYSVCYALYKSTIGITDIDVPDGDKIYGIFIINKYAFSYLCTLKTWHYPHLLLRAVLRFRAAAAPAVQQSIDISYPPGPQQQTRCALLQQANRTERQTDRWTDTVPFHRLCFAYCADSANN